MKKTLIALTIFFAIFLAAPVFAKEYHIMDGQALEIKMLDGTQSGRNGSLNTKNLTDELPCGSILGCAEKQENRGAGYDKKYQDTAYYLRIIFIIMKYVGIILCIVFSVVDFAKTIISDDKDGYKKVVTRTIKRLVFAAIIFFLPTIIMQLLNMINVIEMGEITIV